MYRNVCPNELNCGAMKQATVKAATAVRRPTVTSVLSAASFLTYSLKISIVKIVAVELSIDAKDETIAADSAANTSPLMPDGGSCATHG